MALNIDTAIVCIKDHIDVHHIGKYPHIRIGEALDMAIVALQEKAERENPKPLSREELWEMVGEPVWTVGVSSNGGAWAGWDIIEAVDEKGVDFGFSTESAEWWSYDLRTLEGKLCSCGWIAYRYKPKEVRQ